jgi:hypothetical protein
VPLHLPQWRQKGEQYDLHAIGRKAQAARHENLIVPTTPRQSFERFFHGKKGYSLLIWWLHLIDVKETMAAATVAIVWEETVAIGVLIHRQEVDWFF